MLRRKIDLSLKVTPTTPYQRSFPPRLPDLEIVGPERSRVEMQSLCRVEPYQLDRHPDEVFMDIIMAHSTPHTHVDVFMHDWYTMFEDLPRNMKWVQRDVSQLPVHEIIGEAAIVDISDVEPDIPVTLDFFKSIGRTITTGKDNEIWGVTLEFNIKYKKPIPLDEEIKVVAKLTYEDKRLFEGTGKIMLSNGEVAATAEGKYLRLSIEKIADFDRDTNEWKIVELETDPENIEI